MTGFGCRVPVAGHAPTTLPRRFVRPPPACVGPTHTPLACISDCRAPCASRGACHQSFLSPAYRMGVRGAAADTTIAPFSLPPARGGAGQACRRCAGRPPLLIPHRRSSPAGGGNCLPPAVVMGPRAGGGGCERAGPLLSACSLPAVLLMGLGCCSCDLPPYIHCPCFINGRSCPADVRKGKGPLHGLLQVCLCRRHDERFLSHRKQPPTFLLFNPAPAREPSPREGRRRNAFPAVAAPYCCGSSQPTPMHPPPMLGDKRQERPRL